MKEYLINVIKDDELTAIKTTANDKEEALENVELIVNSWKYNKRLHLYLFDYDELKLNEVTISTYSHFYKKTTK